MSHTEKLLTELIALPSVNPAFLPAKHPKAGEQRVADYLASVARRASLDVEFQTVSGDRRNVIVRLRPRGTIRHRVILAPHMDTVAATEEQFIPQKRGGKIFGRGACDTKGSIAAMLGAVCDVAKKGPRPSETEIVFVGLIDEENAQTGSRKLASSGTKADLAIVGEPTQTQVVTAHKGSLWLQLETRGKSAHGSRPELGENAVAEMARVVSFVESDYARLLKGRRHPLLGRATVSVGVIRGGTQANIVPDHCEIWVDRRTLPGETEERASRELNSLLRKRGLKARLLKGKLYPCMPLETDIKLPFVSRFLESVGQRKPLGVNFFCDAAVLAAGGTPSVVFGPGDIAQAHTADEWISINSLEKARTMLTRFLGSLP